MFFLTYIIFLKLSKLSLGSNAQLTILDDDNNVVFSVRGVSFDENDDLPSLRIKGSSFVVEFDAKDDVTVERGATLAFEFLDDEAENDENIAPMADAENVPIATIVVWIVCALLACLVAAALWRYRQKRHSRQRSQPHKASQMSGVLPVERERVLRQALDASGSDVGCVSAADLRHASGVARDSDSQSPRKPRTRVAPSESIGALSIAPTDLAFGDGELLEVNVPLKASVALRNQGRVPLEFRVHAPIEEGLFDCVVRPGAGRLAPGESVELEIVLQLHATMRIDRIIEVSFRPGLFFTFFSYFII